MKEAQMFEPTRALALCAIVLSIGCVGTETGNPFTHVLDPTELGVGTTGAMIQQVTVDGVAGTVTPATGQVHAWGLGNDLEGVVVPVATDGSFSLQVPGQSGELVRLQVRAGPGEMSAPVDLAIDSSTGASVYSVFSSALPCLRTEPSLVLQIDRATRSTASIVVINECDMAVTRAPARLRRADLGFTLVDDGNLELAPGERSTLLVTASGATDVPSNVLIDVSDPVRELRAITVGVD